ncbi:MAG: sulfur carrier protein ThiS [Planctomycetes bacterium]|nr:sulfur carrier protein ThiS [Planctomycetota bacterium]
MSDGSPELEVLVNGQPRRLPHGSTVADLLVAMALKPAQVAVERNKQIVRRADHGATLLEAGDRLEVVTFFGGG